MQNYASLLFDLHCSPEILTYMHKSKLPNKEKEFSETWGVLEAARSRFSSRHPYDCFVAGDGHRTLTGYCIALNTAWNVTSIDPALKYPAEAKRFRAEAKLLQDFRADVDEAIIILPHSHVKLDWIPKSIRANVYHIIALPCCVSQECFCGRPPDISFIDPLILSAKNKINVWI